MKLRLLKMNKALAGNDGSEAGIERVQADYWKAEVDEVKTAFDKIQLRAIIDGVISTPHVEDFTGRKLQQGETFAEIVDPRVRSSTCPLTTLTRGCCIRAACIHQTEQLSDAHIPRGRHGGQSEGPGCSRSTYFYSRVSVANSDGLSCRDGG